jgi:hypothetical protein
MCGVITELHPYVQYSHKQNGQYVYKVGYRFFTEDSDIMQDIYSIVKWNTSSIPLTVIHDELSSIPIRKGSIVPIAS